MAARLGNCAGLLLGSSIDISSIRQTSLDTVQKEGRPGPGHTPGANKIACPGLWEHMRMGRWFLHGESGKRPLYMS